MSNLCDLINGEYADINSKLGQANSHASFYLGKEIPLQTDATDFDVRILGVSSVVEWIAVARVVKKLVRLDLTVIGYGFVNFAIHIDAQGNSFMYALDATNIIVEMPIDKDNGRKNKNSNARVAGSAVKNSIVLWIDTTGKHFHAEPAALPGKVGIMCKRTYTHNKDGYGIMKSNQGSYF